MVTCPVCEGTIDVDEEDVDEGDTVSCDECGADLRVVGTDPLELESAEEVEEDDEEDENFLEEDEEEARPVAKAKAKKPAAPAAYAMVSQRARVTW